MIEELMKLKKQIDTMVETYKDLHPDEPIGIWESNEIQQERALKKVREGTYESTFSKKQRQKTTEHGEGPSSLCVYGDS